MDERCIETFLALVEGKSLSNAAKLLFITPSAVSKRLRYLEKSLGGVTLVTRGKGKKDDIHLTTQGENFWELVKRWRQLHMELSDLSTPRATVFRTLRVLAPAAFYVGFLPLLTATLTHSDPRYHFAFIGSQSSEIYALMERGGADVAISLVDSIPHILHVRQCHSEPMVGVCAVDSPLAGQNNVPTSALDPNYELQIIYNTEFAIWHDTYFSPNPRITLDSVYMLPAFITKTSPFWSLVTLSSVKALSRAGQIASFGLQTAPPPRRYYLLTHRNPHLDLQPMIDLFLSSLEKLFAENEQNAALPSQR